MMGRRRGHGYTARTLRRIDSTSIHESVYEWILTTVEYKEVSEPTKATNLAARVAHSRFETRGPTPQPTIPSHDTRRAAAEPGAH